MNVAPVPGGNLPPTTKPYEAIISFKEGGAFEFNAMWMRLRERLAEARESGLHTVTHLEDLPQYEQQAATTTAAASAGPPAYNDVTR